MIDNSQLSAYHEKQAKQDSEIAVLKSRIDSVEKDLDEFKNKDKEELDQRLRSIEKQVWGAGAVLTAFIVIGGIVGDLDIIPDRGGIENAS